MTTYVADCSPYWYLWADDAAAADLMATMVGNSMAGVEWAQSVYSLTIEEAADALLFGATLTDRFGRAEWRAKQEGRKSMLEKIRIARSQGCV